MLQQSLRRLQLLEAAASAAAAAAESTDAATFLSVRAGRADPGVHWPGDIRDNGGCMGWVTVQTCCWMCA